MLTLFQLQHCPALYINIENFPHLWQKSLQDLPNWRRSNNINKIIFKHYKLNNGI
ncbi:MAG TPA: SctK family type III secretion system sorting platform protein [Arsenophonus sp.]